MSTNAQSQTQSTPSIGLSTKVLISETGDTTISLSLSDFRFTVKALTLGEILKKKNDNLLRQVEALNNTIKLQNQSISNMKLKLDMQDKLVSNCEKMEGLYQEREDEFRVIIDDQSKSIGQLKKQRLLLGVLSSVLAGTATTFIVITVVN